MTTRLLKNGGWRNVGEFVEIQRDGEDHGIRWQLCSYTCQIDQNGERRSRRYYEIRFTDDVIALPASVRTLRDALAKCREIVSQKGAGGQPR